MNTDLLLLDHWESLEDTERRATAQQLAQQLPHGFALQSLANCTLDTQSHPVAFFDWNPANGRPGEFALIPGGEVTLGYDRSHPFLPTEAHLESWQETQEYYDGLFPDLTDFLNNTLTPHRTVILRPFLMETTLLSGESLDETISESRSLGFRLPTSDEWEWACGAGAQTLWRWGNDCPMDDYPCHYPHYSDANKTWDLHRKPNAFGLHIANDDYSTELCEAGVLRGGDGGSSSCAGVGFMAAWLTLATAYVPSGQEMLEEFSQPRRVFPL